MEFIFLGRFVQQLSFTIDYPVGSIVFLFKSTNHSPSGERFEVKMFELKTGQRKEYFQYFLDNPEFDRYFIYPKYSVSYETETVKKEFENLPEVSGVKFYP